MAHASRDHLDIYTDVRAHLDVGRVDLAKDILDAAISEEIQDDLGDPIEGDSLSPESLEEVEDFWNQFMKLDNVHNFSETLVTSGANPKRRTSTQDRPFKCNVCSLAFKRRCHLKIHKRTHSGKKPHKGDVCSKKFTTNTALTVHMRVHTDERPFKCTFEGCNARFKQNMHRIRHEKRHTGERPFQCRICGKAFAQQSSCTRHENTVPEK